MPTPLTHRLLRPLLLALLVLLPALAQPAPEAPAPEVPASSQPFPTLDAGMHTASIRRFAVDRAGRYGVSASHDKTARVWDLRDGRLLQTLRVPVGPGDEGKLYAVAISADGATVAVGGWTGPGAGQDSVFFFDRASGRLQGRIAGLPNVVNHLTWSPDGQRLAIAMGAGEGIRVHGATPPFAELGRDADYGGASYSVDFDAGGRLVSTALDGKLRLYDRQLKRVAEPQALAGGNDPFFARFSPDGRRIAVGFGDSTAVQIVSAADLRPLTRLDTGAADNGDLSKVAWSADGRRVLAAGTNDVNGQRPIRVFDPDSGRQLAVWPVSTNTVTDLQPLADGRVLYASGEPSWGIVDRQGRVGRRQRPPQEDHRGNFDGFRISADGALVAFVHETWRDGAWQRSGRVFDWRSLRLEAAAAPPELTPPRRDGLKIEDWKDSTRPRLADQPLPLEPYEISRSLAVAADGQHFALGADWYLRWFDAVGKPQWETSVPVASWLVNLSADGRFVVAALGDGTLRWYRTQDGSEALALFVHADGERWVAWTPEGFFAASSPEAEQLFGYTLNQGRDKEAEFVSSAQLREQFFRPALLTARLDGNEAAIAAAVKEVGEVRELLVRGLPPELGAPKLTELGNGEYELQVDVTPRSGGVGRASVRVNGTEKVAPGRELPVGGFYSQRLALPPGPVKLEVAIYAAGNALLSQTRTVELQVPEPRVVPLRKPRLHVVAVGVSRYYDASLRDGVSFAAADARSLADTLRRHRDSRLVELAEPLVLTELNATREGIVAALQAVARDAQLEDMVVLYLAGHGTQDDAGDYHYQPYEARYTNRAALLAQSVSGTQLRRLLEGIQANKLVVLLDTCASSKFYLATAPGRSDPASKEAIARLGKLSGRAVIAASAREAREHPSLRHGLFTDAMLRGLGGAAANATGDVMVSGLADYVEDDVEKNALRLFGNAQITQREFAPEFRNFALTRKR